MNEKAINEIEITQIDRRYEEFRLENKIDERIISNSMLECGIRDALLCVVDAKENIVLLDGFKRLRCAIRLKIHTVPTISLGSDEVDGILQFIRLANARSLNILEQSALVDQLNGTHGMRIKQIAHHLERSPAWVSVRLGMIQEMTTIVRKAVFSGQFPVRAYMYNLRSFTRVKKIPKEEIDTFVQAVAGKSLSTRDIETLAYGYFHGGDYLKEQIEQGKLEFTLKQLRRKDLLSEDHTLGPQEQRVIKDLELVQKYMGSIRNALTDKCLCTKSFFQVSDLLVEGILSQLLDFQNCLQDFHDKRR
ncbi:MAG: chromosome partitioning protein ParB [Candidatus Brocadiaceae bacterium]|nr:chromosome partitioning protein ParB [Candidatus Brocadiaceae bacterium]